MSKMALKKGDVVYLPMMNVELLKARNLATSSDAALTAFRAKMPKYKLHRRRKKAPKNVELTERDKWLLSGNYNIRVGNRWIAPMLKPAKGGGQMEFR